MTLSPYQSSLVGAVVTMCLMFAGAAAFREERQRPQTAPDWNRIQLSVERFRTESPKLVRFDGCVRAERLLQCSGEEMHADFPVPSLVAFECDEHGCRRTW